MNFFGLCQMRPSGMHQVAIRIGSMDLLAHHLLYAIHLERGQEFTIRHRFDTVLISAYADEFLHMRIPGRHVFIPDRPGNAIAKPFRIDKFIFTPSLAGASPGEGLPSYLVSPYPFKRLFLNIRMVLVLYEKMGGAFINPVALAYEWVVLQILRGHPEPVPEFPWRHVSGRIILDMDDVPPAFQDEGL